METIDPVFASALSSGRIPGIILAAASTDSRLNYLKAYGRTSSNLNSPPLAPDATLWIASATKLFTAVAALQCVDRGLISLDEDVGRILPELKKPKILKSWDEEGRPVLEEAKTSISLRMLLSHTSGLAYDSSTPALQKYLKYIGEETGFRESWMSYMKDPFKVRPLLFEPGDGWAYSTGLDWVGLMVERLSGAETLGAYMQKYIWKPLGMNSSTFRLSDRPDIEARLPIMASRSSTDTLVDSDVFTRPLKSATRHIGGTGMYSSASDFMKLLLAMLRNDGTLLSKEIVAELLTPQVKNSSYMADESNEQILGDIWPNEAKVQCNHSLAGVIAEEDLSSGRRKGSVMWYGGSMIVWYVKIQSLLEATSIAQLFQWLDPESEVCGFFASQMMPGPPDMIDLNGDFEKAVYKTLKQIR